VLEAQVRHEAQVTRVVLRGELHMGTEQPLIDALDRLRDQPSIEIDFAEVGYCDSTGISVLLAAQRQAIAEGRRLYIINPTGAVATILQLTGVLFQLTNKGA
jgi:anti-anti-sigma factor